MIDIINNVIGKEGYNSIGKKKPRFPIIGTSDTYDVTNDICPVIRIDVRLNEMTNRNENKQYHPIMNIEFQQSFALALYIQ